MDQDMCNILCSLIPNDSGWYGVYNSVFVKFNGTKDLYILSEPATTGICDVPVYEP